MLHKDNFITIIKKKVLKIGWKINASHTNKKKQPRKHPFWHIGTFCLEMSRAWIWQINHKPLFCAKNHCYWWIGSYCMETNVNRWTHNIIWPEENLLRHKIILKASQMMDKPNYLKIKILYAKIWCLKLDQGTIKELFW
jgi:hypothetical protein